LTIDQFANRGDNLIQRFSRKVFKMLNRFAGAAAFLLALALLVATTAVAQGPASIKKPDTAATLSATDDVLKTVSRMRDLQIKEPVKSAFKTRDEIELSVIRDLDESTPPAEFNASQKTLAKLGLVPQNFELREYVVKLLREQVAGYYEPKTREFYLAAWLPLGEQKKVMAHELVHALQDQHFNLRRFEKWPKGDSDAELAVHALVEGEATLVMILYDFEQQGMRNIDISKLPPLTERLSDNDSESNDPNYPVLSSAPRVLRENLQFPYVYGAGFAQAVLKSASWAGLNEAYKTLPASTEQIMHPDKYLAHEMPVKIELPDLAADLGNGWKQADADVNGEFGYFIILSEFLPKFEARTAAQGWGGDRYALYENNASRASALVQYTAWDTPGDAREFFAAYSERTEQRYKLRHDTNDASTRRTYETSEGLVGIELRNKDVVIVEGAENREQLARIQSHIWLSPKK
jgi:Zn-dependent peptidase ImmA (M78 family)